MLADASKVTKSKDLGSIRFVSGNRKLRKALHGALCNSTLLHIFQSDKYKSQN